MRHDRRRNEQVGITITGAIASTRRDPTVTAPPVYVRFNALTGGYAHDYSSAELRPWVRFLRAQAAAEHDGFAFFNNDARARAPANAAALIEWLGDAGRPRPIRRGGSDG